MKNILILCAMLACATSSVSAQDYRGRLDLTPYIGALVPANEVVKSGALATGSPAAKHQVDLLFGGKLTYWFGEAIGVEADVAVAPNALTRSVSRLPQRGQAVAGGSANSARLSDEARGGGAMPWARIFSRPSGVIQSVVQAGESCCATRKLRPYSASLFAMERPMTSVAGHPE